MAFILACEYRVWVEYSPLIFERLHNELLHLRHTIGRFTVSRCTYSVVKYPAGVIESTVV